MSTSAGLRRHRRGQAAHRPEEEGKLTPQAVERLIIRVGDEHAVQPRLLTISQSTELGTVYTLEELRALVELAHARGLLVHVDGARLSNAAAALDVPLRALTTDLGVDLCPSAGTKNGLLGGEAVVLLNPELAEGFQYLRKQSLQLASKMRFLAAQFEPCCAGTCGCAAPPTPTRWPRRWPAPRAASPA